eukprot:Nk52_evm6s2010 gene=Nk52_evmTU6s2010
MAFDKKEFLCACERGNLEVVKKMLPNAIPRRRSSLVQFFMGKEVDVTDAEGYTAMCLAALYDHVKIIDYLYFQGMSYQVNMKNAITGTTPLMLACIHGHEDSVVFLLEHGADVNMVDETGRTALHYAAKNCRQECVRSLLEHNADPWVKNSVGHTPEYSCDHYLTKQLILGAQKETRRGSDGDGGSSGGSRRGSRRSSHSNYENLNEMIPEPFVMEAEKEEQEERLEVEPVAAKFVNSSSDQLIRNTVAAL